MRSSESYQSEISDYLRPTIKATKEMFDKAYQTTLNEDVKYERRLFHEVFGIEDKTNGMSPFLEKKDPVWKHHLS